jgi:hypothetical protein
MSDNLYASSFDQCLLAVRDQLYTIEAFSKNTASVRIVADDETNIPLLTGDLDILLMGGGGTAQGPIQDGCLRQQSPVRRVVEVNMRSRDNRDSVDNDELWVIQHYQIEHAIVDRLQGFPTEFAGAADAVSTLFREPMRLIGFSKASRRKKQKLSNGDAGIGISVISFEIIHVLAVEQQPV